MDDWGAFYHFKAKQRERDKQRGTKKEIGPESRVPGTQFVQALASFLHHDQSHPLSGGLKGNNPFDNPQKPSNTDPRHTTGSLPSAEVQDRQHGMFSHPEVNVPVLAG